MKKIVLLTSLFIAFGSAISFSYAATRTASATASWEAKAIKDTKSILVVVPMKSLSFDFSEATQSFNTQEGAFSITIGGQSGATDFKLDSKIISNKLSRVEDQSELTVGVLWNGKELNEATPTTMIDTSTNINSGLEALSLTKAFAGSERVSTISNFLFNIKSATVNGTKVQMGDIADGFWDGNVKIQFTATWSGDFVTA